jgi:hypothetical protein
MTIFTHADETRLERSMIKDLLAISERLKTWERKFLNSVQMWAGNFTLPQARRIVMTHAKYFPELYKLPKERRKNHFNSKGKL